MGHFRDLSHFIDKSSLTKSSLFTLVLLEALGVTYILGCLHLEHTFVKKVSSFTSHKQNSVTPGFELIPYELILIRMLSIRRRKFLIK